MRARRLVRWKIGSTAASRVPSAELRFQSWTWSSEVTKNRCATKRRVNFDARQNKCAMALRAWLHRSRLIRFGRTRDDESGQLCRHCEGRNFRSAFRVEHDVPQSRLAESQARP